MSNAIYFLMFIALLSGCGSVDTAGRLSAEGLAPCPSSPNCVSSMESEGVHYVPPLSYAGPSDEAFGKLLSVLETEPRCRITAVREEAPAYIRAEFRSRIFRFVDDVEFLFAESPGRIHVRSASRVGYSDMGVNRKRVERLRERFTALSP